MLLSHKHENEIKSRLIVMTKLQLVTKLPFISLAMVNDCVYMYF